ncbi:MAG TPA: peptide deformylase [Gammaproteobacteria bacterium]|nr:peptide deformylase [Gammaproteobacteria bacterium]
MAILDILHFPDPRLRMSAAPVVQVDDKVRQTVDDMFETMYQAPGIGLAAIQVDIQQQIIVIDVAPDKNEPLCLINAEILSREGEEEMEEGCLSIPDVYDTVRRAEKVKVRALDRDGQPFELETGGLLAVCIQHEMDHLVGKLFIDYLSPLKRQRIQKKLEKTKRLGTDKPDPRKQAI